MSLGTDAGDGPGGQGVVDNAPLQALARVLHLAGVLAVGGDAGQLGAAVGVHEALGLRVFVGWKRKGE